MKEHLYNFFDSYDEAEKIVEKLNEYNNTGNQKTTFQIVPLDNALNLADDIRIKNQFTDTALFEDIKNTSGKFFIVMGMDAENAYKNKTHEYSTIGVFKNKTNDLILTSLNSVKTKGVDYNGPENLKINKIEDILFSLPNPLNNSPTITTVDDKKRIVNNVIIKNTNGVYGLHKSDYYTVFNHLDNYIRNNENASIYSKSYNSTNIYSELAKKHAGTQLSILDQTFTTNVIDMQKIKGYEGINLSSTHNSTTNEYILNIKNFEDFYNSQTSKAISDIENAKKSGVEKFKLIFNKDTTIKEIIGLDKNNNQVKDFAFKNYKENEILREFPGSQRFFESYKTQMSLINHYITPTENSEENIKLANEIVDSYYAGKIDKNTAITSLQEYVKKSYVPHGEKIINELLDDSGKLSTENLNLFLDNKNRFNAFLDVNRQSINTEDYVTEMSGAIMDGFGYFNKEGQRKAQSDAKMSKAILEIDGQEINLSQSAKKWYGNIKEFKYKSIETKREEVDILAQKASNALGINNPINGYGSQYNYMLYAFHNLAFQDSDTVTMDLAMENISKFDGKNQITIPYQSIDNFLLDEITNSNVTNLKNENIYIEGTAENQLIRKIVGEERFEKHFYSKYQLADEFEHLADGLFQMESLQTEQERIEYARDNNTLIKRYNEFFKKHTISSNSQAKAQIIDSTYVNKGQQTSLTGINMAIINGFEFTDDGIIVKTTGLVNQGDSTKYMKGTIKGTTQAVLASMGVKGQHAYLPVSGVHNEKILSNKRGFAGELLERTLNTSVFNFMTYGDSDDLESNFNLWKKTLEETKNIEGVNGKKLNIFEALNFNIKYENNKLVFTNENIKNAISGFEFGTNNPNSSVNKKIFQNFTEHVQQNFGYSLNPDTNKTFIETIFGSLAESEEILKNKISFVASKNLSLEARRELMSTFVRGQIEVINPSSKGSQISELGEVRGLRLLNNIHIMKETKSRADHHGLSLGRLSVQVLREAGMVEMADLIEQKIVYDNSEKLLNYVVASGNLENYETGSLNFKTLFSKNIVNLKDKSIRYNLKGTNQNINSYFETSPLGQIIEQNFDMMTGSTKGTQLAKITNFNDNFIETLDNFAGIGRQKNVSKLSYVLAVSDFDEFLTKTNDYNLRKKDINFAQLKDKLMEELKDTIQNDKLRVSLGSGSDSTGWHGTKELQGYRGKFFKEILFSLDEEKANELLNKHVGKGMTIYDFSNFYNEFESNGFKFSNDKNEEKFNLFKNFITKKDYILNKIQKNENNIFHLDENIRMENKPFQFNIEDKTKLKKIIYNIFENSEDLNNYDSSFSQLMTMVENYEDFNERNIHSLDQIKKIVEQNELNVLIPNLSIDEKGGIVVERVTSELEKLIKNNIDLTVIDEEINYTKKRKGLIGDKIKELTETKYKNDIDLSGKEKIKIQKELKEKENQFKTLKKLVKKQLDQINSQTVVNEEIIDKMTENERIKIAINITNKNELGEEKYSEIDRLRKEGLNQLKEKFTSKYSQKTRVKNSQIVSPISDFKGSLLNNFIEFIDQDDITYNHIEKRIGQIDDHIKLLSKNSKYNNEMNTLIKERDIIKNLVNENVKEFISSALNNKILNTEINQETIDKVIQKVSNISEFNIDTLNDLDTFLLSLNGIGEGDVKSLIYKTLNSSSAKVLQIDELENKKQKIASSMLTNIKKIYESYGENFFKKGGALEKLTTTRFRTSIEYSPKEGTILADYASAEMRDIIESFNTTNNAQTTIKKEKEFFSALQTVFGYEIKRDIEKEYNLAKKKQKIASFDKVLKERLENLSGVVIGDKNDFKNAGLESIISKDMDKTDVTYSLNSRNPHQYQSSLRSTRFVALGDEDKNMSFLARMFGTRNKMAETQGNLYLFGKKTAILAHADHDGDKLQAMFMSHKDLNFLSKKEANNVIKKMRNNFQMFQLLGDYQGNFKEKISNVEKNKETFNSKRKIHNFIKKQYNKDKNFDISSIEDLIMNGTFNTTNKHQKIKNIMLGEAEYFFGKTFETDEEALTALRNKYREEKIEYTNVEKSILKKAKIIHGENLSDEEAFKKIEHIYYSQKMERIRGVGEVFDEDLSHAEISFFHMLKDKKTLENNKNEFGEVFKKIDDKMKFKILANTIGIEDIDEIEKYFDPEMLKNKEFSEKINKIKEMNKNGNRARELLLELSSYNGKIKWQNTTLADSVYSSYTGIARTGSVHYALTNLRDSATTLLSSQSQEIINKNVKTLRMTDRNKMGIYNFINNYIETNLFVGPNNTLDILIDKLAISAKLGEGSNPYHVVNSLENLSNSFMSDFGKYINKNGIMEFEGNVSNSVDFELLKKLSIHLMDNIDDEVDLKKIKELMPGGKKITNMQELLSSIYKFAKFDETALENIATMAEMDGKKAKSLNLTNKELIKIFGNINTIFSKTVLGLGSGTVQTTSKKEKFLLNGEAYTASKIDLFKTGQNFFYAMKRAFGKNNEDFANSGHRMNSRIMDVFKDVIQYKVEKQIPKKNIINNKKYVLTREIPVAHYTVENKIINPLEPEKIIDSAKEQVKKTRGRKKKEQIITETTENIDNKIENVVENVTKKVKKTRGRKKKSGVMDDTIEQLDEQLNEFVDTAQTTHDLVTNDVSQIAINNGKEVVEELTDGVTQTISKSEQAGGEIIEKIELNEELNLTEKVPKKRGRKKKIEEAVEAIEEKVPKKRGRKKANTETKTLKIDYDSYNEIETKEEKIEDVVRQAEANKDTTEKIIERTVENTSQSISEEEYKQIINESERISNSKTKEAKISDKEAFFKSIDDKINKNTKEKAKREEYINELKTRMKELEDTFAETKKSKEEFSIEEMENQRKTILKLEEDLYKETQATIKLQDEIDVLKGESDKTKKILDELKIQLDQSEKNKGNLIEDIKNLRKELIELTKGEKTSSKTHEKSIKNLNEAHEKNVQYLKEKILKLEEEVRNNEEIKIAYYKLQNEMKELVSEYNLKPNIKKVSETGDAIAKNIKTIYNKNKTTSIVVGTLAVLGSFFHMFQKRRSVVDVDLQEKEYEKTQGSLYRNLGQYNINTNIRGVR